MNHSYPEHSWRHRHTAHWAHLYIQQWSDSSPIVSVFHQPGGVVDCSTQKQSVSGTVRPSEWKGTLPTKGLDRNRRGILFLTSSKKTNQDSFLNYSKCLGQISHLEKASSKLSSISWKKKGHGCTLLYILNMTIICSQSILNYRFSASFLRNTFY